MMYFLFGIIPFYLLHSVIGGCPFLRQEERTFLEINSQSYKRRLDNRHHNLLEYGEAARKLDWLGVEKDINFLLTNSRNFWPADFGNYGPFFIRFAWHCSGSYRVFDGRGGCDGGRIRFEPRRSWEDNVNLDKAKDLLWPIKEKYGLGLSWGDLIILSGTIAIKSMGGPFFGFCGGRVDAQNGADSVLMGPTPEQQELFPCQVNGQCEVYFIMIGILTIMVLVGRCLAPLGSTTIGLIYVNPEGPMANPLPENSALEIRDTFQRMGMNDSETVALIGGGHAFGKVHGACPDGPGEKPQNNPIIPYKGTCNLNSGPIGKGYNTFTSGLEGQWSDTPTLWNNTYFRNLLDNEFELQLSPGLKHQWGSATLPSNHMMLTTDIALRNDSDYLRISQLYKNDIKVLANNFKHAWYKVTHRDSGPIERCVGPWIPFAQEWQFPLPPPPKRRYDIAKVKKAVKAIMSTPRGASIGGADLANGKNSHRSLLIYLAWQCGSTYRYTDHLGGCNGARLRFSPGLNFPMNIMVDQALTILEPIKIRFATTLSWADLIVLAGNTAIEESGGVNMPFCPGRSDALDGSGWKHIQPNGNYSQKTLEFTTSMKLLNLTDREVVALAARPRSPQLMCRLGYESTTWTPNSEVLSNDYAIALTSAIWEPYKNQFKSVDKSQYMLPTDMIIGSHLPYRVIAEEHASSNEIFLKDFANAWIKVMTNDRFDGPTGNLCPQFVDNNDNYHMRASGESPMLGQGVYVPNSKVFALGIIIFVVLFLMLCFCAFCCSTKVCRRKVYAPIPEL